MGQGDGSVAGHAVVVGREERERARQHRMMVVLEEVSNLPERVMDEAAVAPLILNRSPSEVARSASPYQLWD